MSDSLRRLVRPVLLLTSMLAAVLMLFAPAASAQDADCYPIPATGCEEPVVKPSVVESPPAAPAPAPPATLAATGAGSSSMALTAAGLLAAGGLAVAATRRNRVEA